MTITLAVLTGIALGLILSAAIFALVPVILRGRETRKANEATRQRIATAQSFALQDEEDARIWGEDAVQRDNACKCGRISPPCPRLSDDMPATAEDAISYAEAQRHVDDAHQKWMDSLSPKTAKRNSYPSDIDPTGGYLR